MRRCWCRMSLPKDVSRYLVPVGHCLGHELDHERCPGVSHFLSVQSASRLLSHVCCACLGYEELTGYCLTYGLSRPSESLMYCQSAKVPWPQCRQHIFMLGAGWQWACSAAGNFWVHTSAATASADQRCMNACVGRCEEGPTVLAWALMLTHRAVTAGNKLALGM